MISLIVTAGNARASVASATSPANAKRGSRRSGPEIRRRFRETRRRTQPHRRTSPWNHSSQNPCSNIKALASGREQESTGYAKKNGGSIQSGGVKDSKRAIPRVVAGFGRPSGIRRQVFIR